MPGREIALALIDLDGFKLSSTAATTPLATSCCLELAAAWTASLRPGDRLARFGCDEFDLLLVGSARTRSATCSRASARAHLCLLYCGVVLCADAESLDEAIERADAQL